MKEKEDTSQITCLTLRALRHTIKQSKEGRVLAKMLGKSYSTLMRELDPSDSPAKLGINTAIQLLSQPMCRPAVHVMLYELGLCDRPADFEELMQ